MERRIIIENIVVAKFGGSSLSDSKQFEKVKAIVLSDEKRRYVVPSAPGKRYKEDEKVTDLLYLCHEHAEKNICFDKVFYIIKKRFVNLVKELHIKLDIEKELNLIEEKIKNGASADYTASRGEYLNGLILANFLDVDFIDASEIIFFKENGTLDEEKTKFNVNNRLSNINKAVIPGFYGSMINGEIKTFSRGGSDITGSIIASYVNSNLYENWTDVSGFLMADPRIVDNPQSIKKVTYRELRELSYMGATVLHEEAIFPVRKAGIPINIKNTNRPEDHGTLIINDIGPASYVGTITGIAGKKDFIVITVEKSMMNGEQGYCRKILSILEDHNVSFEHMPSGVDTVSLVISEAELDGKLEAIIKEIDRECNPEAIEVHPHMALIAVVGRGMNRTIGISSKIFKALALSEVNVRMVSQGSSEITIIIGVENNQFEKAIKSIYEVFGN